MADDGFKEVKFGARHDGLKKKRSPSPVGGADDGFKVTRFGASNNASGKGVAKAHGEGRFDICIVFPTNKNSGGFQSYGEDTMQAIEVAGGETYSYYDAERTKIFVLVRFPLGKLTLFADATNFKMQLDPILLEAKCKHGDEENHIGPIAIGHDPHITKFGPYEHIYCRYEHDHDDMYWRAANEVSGTSFTECIRLKVIHLLLESTTSKGGCALKMRKLELEKKILAYYPMPNLELKNELQDEWLMYCMGPNDQPFEKIRSYFGEKISLFFEFRAHLTSWLLAPALVGLALECVVVSTFDFSNSVIPFFSLFIAVWSVLMTEFWKRREISVAMEAGMVDMEHTLQDRPEFKGVIRPSLVNGTPETYYPPASARTKLFGSFSVISVFVLCVIGVIAGIYTLRFVLYQKIGSEAQIVASVINVVQIQVLTFIYDFIAFKLTDLENQRNDVLYEDSMIVKLFLFQFVNNYSSFYYLAFVAGSLPVPPGANPNSQGECGYPDCMEALAINLGIIFGSRLIMKNFLNLFIPWYTTRSRRQKEVKNAGDKALSPAEQEFVKQPFDLIRSSLTQYADVATFFGYTVFFTSALPAAPFFAFINTYIDIRFNAFSMLNQYRRPVLTGCQDIGTWQSIFEISSTIGVITNAGLIIFTMKTLNRQGFSNIGKLWIFIGFQWVLFFAQVLIRAAVPDVPRFVTIQKARTDFINSKIIDKVSDDDDTDLLKATTTSKVIDIQSINPSAPGI